MFNKSEIKKSFEEGFYIYSDYDIYYLYSDPILNLGIDIDIDMVTPDEFLINASLKTPNTTKGCYLSKSDEFIWEYITPVYQQ